MSDSEDCNRNDGITPGGKQDAGETFSLIRNYFDRKFDSMKAEIIAEASSVNSSRRENLMTLNLNLSRTKSNLSSIVRLLT